MFISEIFRIDERLIDISKELEKYKDREDIFISFSDYPKLGIYPSSSYDTPIGIYAYPLKEIYQDVVDNTIPFAGNRKFVIVFSANGIIEKDLNPAAENGYSEADWNRDFQRIKEKFYNDFEKIIKEDRRYGIGGNNEIDKITDLMMNVETVPPFLKTSTWARQTLMNGLKYNLSDNIPENVIKKIEEIIEEFHKEITPQKTNLQIDKIISNWANKAKLQYPGGKFWNVTRNLAEQLSVLKIRNGRPSVIWTAIMRSLGYEGFTDRTGTGLIHENEPCQAVFFSTKNIKLVEILQNIRKSFAGLLSSARYYPLYTEDKNKKIILDLLEWYMNHPEIWTANNDNQFINTLFSLPRKLFIHNPRWIKLVMLPKVIKMVDDEFDIDRLAKELRYMKEVDLDSPVTKAYEKYYNYRIKKIIIGLKKSSKFGS